MRDDAVRTRTREDRLFGDRIGGACDGQSGGDERVRRVVEVGRVDGAVGEADADLVR